MGCLFCDIVAGLVDAEVIFKDKNLLVLHDINPQAPIHLLILPVKHFTSLAEATVEPELLSAILTKCAILGRELGGEGGYRIVVNTGADGGQTVGHLHFHLLAGRKLRWPPG